MEARDIEIEALINTLEAAVEGAHFSIGLTALAVTHLQVLINLSDNDDTILHSCLIEVADATIRSMQEFKSNMLINNSAVTH